MRPCLAQARAGVEIRLRKRMAADRPLQESTARCGFRIARCSAGACDLRSRRSDELLGRLGRLVDAQIGLAASRACFRLGVQWAELCATPGSDYLGHFGGFAIEMQREPSSQREGW